MREFLSVAFLFIRPFQETGELRIRKGDVDKVRLMAGTSEKGAGWNHLMASGVIEYIDCEEEETSMVAMFHKDLVEKGK